jgi:hypothetical protein
MLTRITALLALALAAGLIAAGCGDDDDETTTAAPTTTETGATGATGAATGEPLSQDEFIAQADAICKKGDQEINAVANETFSGGQPSQEEQEQFVTETVVPNIQKQIDGLSGLTPPEGDEDEVAAIVDAAQRAVDEVEQDPSSIGPGTGAGPFAEANRLAEDYGLEECGG